MQDFISEAINFIISISLFVNFIVAEIVNFIGFGNSIFIAPVIGTGITMLILVISSFQVDGQIAIVIGAIGTSVSSIILKEFF